MPRLDCIVLVLLVPRGPHDDKGMPTANLRSKERGGWHTPRSSLQPGGRNTVAEIQAVFEKMACGVATVRGSPTILGPDE